MADFIAVTQTKAWQKLIPLKKSQLLPPFDGAMVKEQMGWTLDLSRSGMTGEALKSLLNAATECCLLEQIAATYSGVKVNFTEAREVLHMSLRDHSDSPLTPEFARNLALKEKERVYKFVRETRHSKITDIVNIGIGGSDLGPKLLTEAMRPFSSGPQVHHISNVDPAHLQETLKKLKPETTLFIIVSKTFTTQETMANAMIAKAWGKNSQFCAITAAPDKAQAFGIDAESIFTFWDWVGGRYSLWSAVGISAMLAAGEEVFERVLSGAHKMDAHFKNTALENNLPVLLALWDIWNVNLKAMSATAILPYEQNLESFARWFQQLAMESNGKRVDRNGKVVDYKTCPTYWGEAGTNGQHAFYQLLHQGTDIIPCEFIGFAKSNYKNTKEHQILLANMLAQAKAFAEGSKGSDAYRDFEGQRPSITLLGDQATPERIGELLALYEHRVMAQGFLWNIPSFDQWGVELGKKLAKDILADWDAGSKQDSATQALLAKIRKLS